MKKSYALSFLLLITVQSMVAENMKRSFQTVCTDIRAVMKGNASPEQKERLIKQGAAMFLAFSISLYCVSALGAMWDGQKVPPIKVRGAFGRADSSLVRQAHQAVPPPMEATDSLADLLRQPTPSPHSALRDDPNFAVRERRGLPDRDGIKRKDSMSMDMPEQLFG